MNPDQQAQAGWFAIVGDVYKWPFEIRAIDSYVYVDSTRYDLRADADWMTVDLVASGRRIEYSLVAEAGKRVDVPAYVEEREAGRPRRPDDLLFTDEYYGICDLQDAAVRLRADAARWNIDVNQRMQSAHTSSDGTARGDIFIPGFGDLVVDTTAIDYTLGLADAHAPDVPQADHVAIVLFRRMLTIEEVATLFEHNVRILQLLRVGHGDLWRHRAAIVQGAPGDLMWLSTTSSFLWLGPYEEEHKFPPRYRVKNGEEFSVSGFETNCSGDFGDGLAPYGIEVVFASKNSNRIVVKASLAQMIDAARLPWIRHVSSMPGHADFNEEPHGSDGAIPGKH